MIVAGTFAKRHWERQEEEGEGEGEGGKNAGK
jgi:hypothetical protein